MASGQFFVRPCVEGGSLATSHRKISVSIRTGGKGQVYTSKDQTLGIHEWNNAPKDAGASGDQTIEVQIHLSPNVKIKEIQATATTIVNK